MWPLRASGELFTVDDNAPIRSASMLLNISFFPLKFLTAILDNDGKVPWNIQIDLETTRMNVLGTILDASSI